jgi:hypothetical protein
VGAVVAVLTLAELVKQINSVFVTVEPSAGGKQPSGQKMLYADLGEANHP